VPLGPPPGINYIDAQLDAQDKRDKAERIKQEAQLSAMDQLAEQNEIINKKLEEMSSKLAEGKP
jgi:hypothetical protein